MRETGVTDRETKERQDAIKRQRIRKEMRKGCMKEKEKKRVRKRQNRERERTETFDSFIHCSFQIQ